MDGRLITSDTATIADTIRLGGLVNENDSLRTVSAGCRRAVLLLCEDPLMARALSRLLGKVGYDVTTVDSTAGGAETDGSARPALVIIDVSDDQSARQIEAAFRALSRFDGIRALWVGDSGEVARREDGHLSKPFTGVQLLSKIASLIENESSSNEGKG